MEKKEQERTEDVRGGATRVDSEAGVDTASDGGVTTPQEVPIGAVVAQPSSNGVHSPLPPPPFLPSSFLTDQTKSSLPLHHDVSSAAIGDPFPPVMFSPFPSSTPLHFLSEQTPAASVGGESREGGVTHLGPSRPHSASLGVSRMEIVESIMHLHAIHQKGGLTDEEYALAKQHILLNSTSFSVPEAKSNEGGHGRVYEWDHPRRPSSSRRSSSAVQSDSDIREKAPRSHRRRGSTLSSTSRHRRHDRGRHHHRRRASYHPHTLPHGTHRCDSLQSHIGSSLAEGGRSVQDMPCEEGRGEHHWVDKSVIAGSHTSRRSFSIPVSLQTGSYSSSSSSGRSRSKSLKGSHSSSSSSTTSSSSSSTSSERFMVLPKSRVWKGLETESTGDPWSLPHTPLPPDVANGEFFGSLTEAPSSDPPRLQEVGPYHAVVMADAEETSTTKQKRRSGWKYPEREPLLKGGSEEEEEGGGMGKGMTNTYASTLDNNGGSTGAPSGAFGGRRVGLRWQLPAREVDEDDASVTGASFKGSTSRSGGAPHRRPGAWGGGMEEEGEGEGGAKGGGAVFRHVPHLQGSGESGAGLLSSPTRRRGGGEGSASGLPSSPTARRSVEGWRNGGGKSGYSSRTGGWEASWNRFRDGPRWHGERRIKQGVERRKNGKGATGLVVELEREDVVKVHYFNSRGAVGKSFSEVALRPEQLRPPTYLRKSKLERPAHPSKSLAGNTMAISTMEGDTTTGVGSPTTIMSPTDPLFASLTGEPFPPFSTPRTLPPGSSPPPFSVPPSSEEGVRTAEPTSEWPSERANLDLTEKKVAEEGVKAGGHTLASFSDPETVDVVQGEIPREAASSSCTSRPVEQAEVPEGMSSTMLPELKSMPFTDPKVDGAEEKGALAASPYRSPQPHHHRHHHHRNHCHRFPPPLPPSLSPLLPPLPGVPSAGGPSHLALAGSESDTSHTVSKSSGSSSFLEQSLNWYWIDVTGKDPSERQYRKVIRALTKKFGLCESFLVDREHLLILPQVCESPTHPGQYLLNLRVASHRVSLADDSAQLLTNRWIILIDLNRSVIITLHRIDTRSMALLRQRWSKVFHQSSVEVSFQEFLLKIIDDAIHTYQLSLDVHEELLDRCELRLFSRAVHSQWWVGKNENTTSGGSKEVNDEMHEKILFHFGDSGSSSFLRQLLDPKSTRKLPKEEINSFLHHLHRRTSVQLRMLNLTLPTLAEAFTKFELCSKELATQMTSTCRELSDRALEIRDDAKTLLDLHLSLQSFHTNELMAVLTRLSLFFTPCTFFAGVYGMNFQYFPELHWEYGYAYFWIVCAVLVLGMGYYFRRYQ